MDYKELSQGAIFSCRVKCTYTEIYIAINNEFIKVFSIQKKDFDGIIGYGEKYDVNNRLIPITLTDEVMRFIAYKAGFIDENGNHIGVVNDNTVLVDKKQYDIDNTNQFTQVRNDSYIIPEIPEIPNKPKEFDVEGETNYLTLIDDVANVYVREVAIDCQGVSEEIVEIEDIIEEDDEKKNYSKLIWIALGAAALLL